MRVTGWSYCIGLCVLALCLGGCTPLQTRQLRDDAAIASVPKTHRLNVPFVKQTHRHCGPATVSMVMQFYGRNAMQADVVDAVFDQAKLGTFQTDVVAYLRSQGFLPYVLPPHISEVIQAVADGYPVIVMQNLGFNVPTKLLSRWHYAVVVGYDLSQQEMILHSGPFESYRLPFKTFERTWARSGYWALAAWPVQREIKAQWLEPSKYLKALIDVDELGALPTPIQAYAHFTASHPNYPRAWFRLGNHQYPQQPQASLHSFANAVHYAAKVEPSHWNNLAFVAHQQGCSALAAMAITCALTQAPHFKPALDTQKALRIPPSGQHYASDALNCPKVACMNAHKSAIILQ